eukprot:Skav226243  [mRNA]  locus=scaffold1218:559096:563128:- [translate_table: standard]
MHRFVRRPEDAPPMIEGVTVLQKTGLCEPADVKDLAKHKDAFTMEHGRIISAQYSFSTTTSFKSLKGPDRENVTKLQQTIKQASQLVVSSFIYNDFIPYMGRLEADFIAKKVAVEPLLGEKSCLCQLPGGVLGSGNGNIIETLKEFCGFMQDLSSTANEAIFGSESPGLEAVKAQAWVRKWQGQSAALLKAAEAFEKIALGSDEADTVLVATMTLGFACLLDNMNTCVSEVFGGQLSAKAAQCAAPYLEFLFGYLENHDDATLTKELFNNFKKQLEEASLIATAMPEGNKFRSALDIVHEVFAMTFFLHGPEKDLALTKYSFVKMARGCSEHTVDEIKDAIQHLVSVTKMESSSAKVADLASMHPVAIARSQEMLAELRGLFIDKLTTSMVDNAVIPAEIDSISSAKEITKEFLDQRFDMAKSQAVSEKSVEMNTCLRDVQVACSHMGIGVADFIDPEEYRKCVGNLVHCLGSKAVQRAIDRQKKPSETALNSLRDALQVASEQSVEIPPSLQALATTLTSDSSK